MGKHNISYKIPYYEADKYRRATPLTMLAYLGEAAVSHNDDLGFNIDKLRSLNHGWMLNRWKVKMDRYPEVGEKIRIETWISNLEKFYATREFMIYDDKDNEIGRATTLWIFLNMTKKRPIRITKELYEATEIIDIRAFDEFYEFEKDLKLEDYIDFHIRRSDIDYNNHVNNSKYLAWMIETVPEGIYKDHILSELEILYRRETTYGNTILAGSKEEPICEESINFLHCIIDKETSENNAMGLTKWKKISQ